MSTDKKKRRYSSISLREKINAVNQIKQGASITGTANKLKINPGTVHGWMKNANSLTKVYNEVPVPSNRFRIRQADNSDVDEATWAWYQEQKAAGQPVNGPLIRAQALLFHKVLGGKQNFAASDGWLSKWKARHNIYLSTNPKKRNRKKKDPLSNVQVIIDFVSVGSAQEEIHFNEKSDEEVSLDEAKNCIDKLILYCDSNSNSRFKYYLEALNRLKNGMYPDHDC